jgi:glycosyltransferase involved in cell wall biosynthesis
LKIAYVHTGQWPSNSPSFTFVTLNAIGLSAEFDQSYLFVKKNSEDDINKILLDSFNLLKPSNLSINRIIHNSIINSNLFYYRKVVKILTNLIESNKLDVVITRNSSFLKYLVPLKKKYGVHIYFESHDFYADLSLRDDINVKKKKHSEKNERKYIPHVSGILCLQTAQKKLYNENFPTVKSFVARTGLHEINNINNEKTYLTYIGSLDKHKGLLQLLQALNLSKTKPRLLIVGGKSSSEIIEIEKQIENNYNPELVEVTGWIDRNNLANYLKQTAIGIIPLTGTFFNKYLTSPLKLFDYYSYCIPVIATDLPTTRELIIEGKTGLFFEDGNINDLANKIDKLFSNKNIIDNMRSEVYSFANNLLWRNRARILKEIFEEQIK